MTNIKQTKKALLCSAMALILCFTMLLGTTFAWFTDTASTNVNTIQAGTLNVALEMKDANGEWVSAEGKTLKFTDNKWEPGCTYELPQLRIVNKGNLALKYKVIITGINGDAKLNEAIDWEVQLGDAYPDRNNGEVRWSGAWSDISMLDFIEDDVVGKLYPANEATQIMGHTNTVYMKLRGHMQETAGNEYQGLKIDGIAITVYATQFTFESDSTGNRYDANATYDIPWDGSDAENTNVPAASQDGKIHISTAAQLVSIMNTSQNENSAYIGKNIVLDNNINLGGQTVKGFGSDQSNFAGDFDGQGFTISNFTVSNDRERYNGLFNQLGPSGSVKNLTVKNATVKGRRMVGVISSNVKGGAVVDNCHVYDSLVISTLKKAGAVVGYTSEGTVTNCTATNCTVYCADNDIVESNEIVGFVNTGSTVTNNTPNNVTVVRGVAPTLVSNATELKTALTNVGNAGAGIAANKTIILTSDIDMSNWTAVNGGSNYWDLTLDGNGHQLTNMSASLFDNLPAKNYVFKNISFNNVQIEDANSGRGHGVAAIVGNANTNGGGSYTIANCHINGGYIKENDGYAAGFVGYAGNSYGSVTFKITDCSVKNVQIVGDDATAGLIGLTYDKVEINNCVVTNNVFTNTNNGYSAAALVGTVIGSGSVTAADVSASSNTYTSANQNYNKNDSVYGYMFVGDGLTYTID